MPIIPLRDLGKAGVNTDLNPFNLPPNAASFAKNIRYESDKITRGGVFRTVGALANNPRSLIGYVDSTGNNQLLYVDESGYVYNWSAGTETAVSPSSGWTAAISDAQVTTCAIDNMIYINRGDHVPFYRSKDSGSAFSLIPTGAGPPAQWDATHRCLSLRAYKGVLMAFNITKGATRFPQMVKWSDFTQWGAAPTSWDITGASSSSAGENTLAEMKGSIVDGCVLRDRMMIYGTEETWFADFIGGSNMFSWDRAFDSGVINTNCVAEHNGIHYVFGKYDITWNDGLQSQSLSNEMTRRFIYDGMDNTQTALFFVVHNSPLNEIMFCYVSNDGYCAFPSSAGRGCNRAAIWNYAANGGTGAWYFADLPYIFCSTFSQPAGGASYDSQTADYADIGGSYAANAGSTTQTLVTGGVAAGSVSRSLRTYAGVKDTSTTYNLDATANQGAYIERLGVDLQELKANLRGYKLVSSIYPEATIGVGAAALQFNFGISDHPSVPTNWGTSQTFDQTFYKLDYNMAGRYLAWRMTQTDTSDFTLSGFDVDITLLGEF